MRRKGVPALVFFLLVVVGSLVYTVVSGNEPVLGLDLQGGVSVVLQPNGPVDDNDTLDQALEIIRNRVDALGVAEPDITRQGDTILVQLPGVKNQDRALSLVGQTAELRFRPVIQVLPPVGEPGATTTTAAGGATTTTAGGGDAATTTTAPATTTTGRLGGLQAPSTTTTASPTTETTVAPTASTIPIPGDTTLPENLNDEGITPRRADRPAQDVVLPERDADGTITTRYHLGPTALTGAALSGAAATLDQAGTWQVNPTFKSGEEGIDLFNQIADTCFNHGPECPTGQLAIVLDQEVISAPAIQQPTFERDQIQITGNFTEEEAKNLALVLKYGALPVQLEPVTTQTVSATLGEDALRAGLIAGLVGLGITALFLIAYYRLLGLIAILGLVVEFALLWSLLCWLGESRGLALTLAGVTGIIVSIGISVDSSVVFFEHIKEDVHGGRTYRSTVDRSFGSSFTTIIKADVASLIGAFLLYWLSVGPVRGFALLLGLSTLLDLVAAWFFVRPVVLITARSAFLRDRQHWLGIPKPREARELEVEPA